MLDTLEVLPPDPILGTVARYRSDPSPERVDLSIGVFRDAHGHTPVPEAIQSAARAAIAEENSKAYMGATGCERFNEAVTRLVLGPSHPALRAGRTATVQTTGASAALRLAADLIHIASPAAALALPDPTWSNHHHVFASAGLKITTFPYYDAAAARLTWHECIQALARLPENSAILLHGCCHNPTGEDLTPEQWHEIAEIAGRRCILPVVDLAYQGLALSLEKDAYGARYLAEHLPQVLIAASCSKNFGLYRDRTGALICIGARERDAQAAVSHVVSDARAIYSMPPHHGADLVTRVLSDPALEKQWLDELAHMRNQLHQQRKLLATALAKLTGDSRYDFLMRQRGLFSKLPLSPAQLDALSTTFHVYLAPGGRVNVAGIRPDNVDRVATALFTVTR